jgi:hypothetical protein
VRAALKILEISVVFRLDDIKNVLFYYNQIILQNAKFIEYAKRSIKENEAGLHCTCLHIVYLLSKGDNLVKLFLSLEILHVKIVSRRFAGAD